MNFTLVATMRAGSLIVGPVLLRKFHSCGRTQVSQRLRRASEFPPRMEHSFVASISPVL